MTLTDLLPILYALMILVAIYAFYQYFRASKSSKKEQLVNENEKETEPQLSPTTPDVQLSKVDEALDWINQWKEVSKLDFSTENEHFFLERMHLDDFSKKLISYAASEIIVANPFIQNCDLSDTLREANRNGINVKIITRPASDKDPEYLEKKQAYLSMLLHEGISLFYDKRVHAKIIVVDSKVAVVSSMNFYGDSSAGVSWEAGLVSINREVVQDISNFLTEMIANVRGNNRAERKR